MSGAAEWRQAAQWPPGEAGMARRIREHDWASTPLGPIEGWRPGLRIAVQLMLAHDHPTHLCVGEGWTQLYNDSYAALVGSRHPAALGADMRRTFAEGDVAGALARVFAGETVTRTDQPLALERDGVTEPAWFDITALPVRDQAGAVFAVMVLHKETTARVLARAARDAIEARQAFLLSLSDALRPLGDPVGVMQAAGAALGRHLGAGRCGYGEVDATGAFFVVARDWTDGMPSVSGTHRIDDFGGAIIGDCRLGRTVVIDDTMTEPRPGRAEPALTATGGVRASLAVPLMKDGRWAAGLFVQQAQPRRWTAEEAALVRDVAERTFAAVERARVEAALRESEERFRGFAENSADVLWIANRDGTRLEYLSPAFERVFGGTGERLMSDLRRFPELVHPEDRERVARLLPRALAGEAAVAHYRVVRPADGRIVHLRDTGFPIRDAAGAVVRVAGIVQDVSDVVRATAALEAEKERFRALAEGIPQLVWQSAARGHWTWASPQWTAFTGLSDAASRGRGWLAAVHPHDRAGALAAWERAGAAEVFEAEYRLRHAADGAWRWFQTRGVPGPRPTEGGAAEWLGASTDVDGTVRAREALVRNAEELGARVDERTAELIAAEESLRQAQKMEAIGRLTGGIAHDFNNMLQGVTGALDMAGRRLEAGRAADVARYMQAARDAAGRAAGLTRRLLAFARRQRLDTRPVDADALVVGIADLLRRTVGPQVSLELVLRDGTGWVLCDPGELESAVLNLCINSRDAMPGGGRLTIITEDVVLSPAEVARHEGAEPGPFVSIRVEDTGTGMPPEVLDRVLEPFFTTKPEGQGTGLGLSQVWGFVRQSGGVLRIESEPGRGTGVRILLPWHPIPADPEGQEATLPEAAADGIGGTVLLVDDEEAVRAPAVERLRELGCRVLEAPDGPAALGRLEQGLRPDLLVTDVGLPGGMDGPALAEAARARRPGLPVLFITGYARVALPEHAEVITKPFSLDALAGRVREILSRRR